MGCASSSQVKKDKKPVVDSHQRLDRALIHTSSQRSTVTTSSGEITDEIRDNPSRRGSRDVPASPPRNGQLPAHMPPPPNELTHENYWPKWILRYAPETASGWWPRKISSYRKLEKIGQGTYSSVYKAQDLTDGKFVALKKVKADVMEDDSVIFLAREINILRQISHRNIVKLYDVALASETDSIFLVMEYMPHDLAGLAVMSKNKFTQEQVKHFMFQLLSALKHCHDQGIMHRDIKGSNLLMDEHGNLKLGDFGLAIQPNPKLLVPLTNRVITLWYRPPEVLMGSTDYDASVDIWSSGCIFAELLHGKPILQSRTEVEQIHQICKLCGSEGMRKLPVKKVYQAMLPAKNMYPRKLRSQFASFPADALDQIDRMLSICPKERGTAGDVLNSEYFRNLPARGPGIMPECHTSHEYSVRIMQKRISLGGLTMQQAMSELREQAAQHPISPAKPLLKAIRETISRPASPSSMCSESARSQLTAKSSNSLQPNGSGVPFFKSRFSPEASLAEPTAVLLKRPSRLEHTDDADELMALSEHLAGINAGKVREQLEGTCDVHLKFELDCENCREARRPRPRLTQTLSGSLLLSRGNSLSKANTNVDWTLKEQLRRANSIEEMEKRLAPQPRTSTLLDEGFGYIPEEGEDLLVDRSCASWPVPFINRNRVSFVADQPTDYFNDYFDEAEGTERVIYSQVTERGTRESVTLSDPDNTLDHNKLIIQAALAGRIRRSSMYNLGAVGGPETPATVEEASAIVQGKAYQRSVSMERRHTYQDESVFDSKSWMRRFHQPIGNSRGDSEADSGPNSDSSDQKLKLVGARQQSRFVAQSMDFSDIFGDNKEPQLTSRSSIEEQY